MGSSLQSLTLSSVGANGGAVLTGTGIFTNPNGWTAFRTIDTDVVVSGISAPNISGVDYYVGKTLTAPFEFLGKVTSLQLYTGAVQVFK